MSETLDFSSSLYSQTAVEQTALAYADFLDCQIDATENHIRVQVHPKVEGVEDLADHFANHALHLSIIESRGGEA